ncbi:hypothetical protein PanWU01x14_055580, partial [Parasponia andersonii]
KPAMRGSNGLTVAIWQKLLWKVLCSLALIFSPLRRLKRRDLKRSFSWWLARWLIRGSGRRTSGRS